MLSSCLFAPVIHVLRFLVIPFFSCDNTMNCVSVPEEEFALLFTFKKCFKGTGEPHHSFFFFFLRDVTGTFFKICYFLEVGRLD